jgi:hypothetical protein
VEFSLPIGIGIKHMEIQNTIHKAIKKIKSSMAWTSRLKFRSWRGSAGLEIVQGPKGLSRP